MSQVKFPARPSLDVSQPYRLPLSVTRIALLFMLEIEAKHSSSSCTGTFNYYFNLIKSGNVSKTP
jgi:hypothetical protein